MNRALGLAALLGTGALVAMEAVDAFPLAPRQWMAFVLLSAFTVIVPLAMLLVLREPSAILRRHPATLLPLLVLKPTLYGLGFVVVLPALGRLQSELLALKLGTVAISVTFTLILFILVWVFYGAWATIVLWQAARGERADPIGALRPALRGFPRTLLFESIGILGMLGAIVILLPLLGGAGPVGHFVFGAFVLAWSLLTAALLPLGLSGDLTIRETFGALFRTVGPGLRRWGPAVVVQLLFLGLVTFVSVSFTERTNEVTTGSDGITRTNEAVTHNRTTNYSVNAKWVGGFEDETSWSEDLMKAVRAPEVAVVTTLLGLLLGVLALGVKLRIMLALMKMEEVP